MIGYEVAVCHIFRSARIFVDGYNNRSILSNDVDFHFTPHFIVYRFRLFHLCYYNCTSYNNR
jgi:hypothetical protein